MNCHSGLKRLEFLTRVITWVTLDSIMHHATGDTLPGTAYMMFWERQSYRDRTTESRSLIAWSWGRGLAPRGTEWWQRCRIWLGWWLQVRRPLSNLKELRP